MVVLKDLFSTWKKGDISSWEDGLSRVPESSIVIFWETAEPSMIEKNSLFQYLKKQGKVHTYPFPLLKDIQLEKWVRERAVLLGGAIHTRATRRLIEFVGADLWRLQTELEKLISFAQGEEITDEMVSTLVSATFEEQIFAFVDAVSQKDGKRILQLLQEERLAGTDDHYLFSMLVRQIRLLLCARALFDAHHGKISKDQIKEELGVHPFVAQKLLAQAKGFSLPLLKEAHGVLYRYDGWIKSGGADPELAVDLFLSWMTK
jgi:DNA polymerase-3 subunit delta